MKKLIKKLRKNRKKTFAVGLSLLLILSSLAAYLTFFGPKSAEAAWYDDAWAYRVKYTISSSSAQTNQKFKIDIDTATLITAGKLQSDCGDSRFTDINGKLLRYYIDTVGGNCNTNSTDYYILIPTINNGNTNIYHYFGNSLAVNGTEASQFSEATCSTCSLGATASEEKGPSPVLYFKFDEAYGTAAYDSTSNGNNATLSAGPSWWSTNYLYRKNTTITAVSALSSGYTAEYVASGSEAADIYNDSLSSGNDFRVLYWNGSWTELDRDLLSFTSSSIRVRWSLQAAVSAGASSSSYYFYYGYSGAGSPPSNVDNVYRFADDFNDASVDTNKWNTTGTISESGGVIRVGDCGIGCDNLVISKSYSVNDGIMEFRARATGADLLSVRTIDTFARSSINSGNPWTDDTSQEFSDGNSSGWQHAIAVDDTSMANSGWAASMSTWYYTKVILNGVSLTFTTYADGFGSQQSTVSYTDTGGRTSGYVGLRCKNNRDAEWDWFYVKDYVATEPTVYVGLEENQSLAQVGWRVENYCLSRNCLFFDGSNDVGTVTNASSIDMDAQLAGAMTFQGWVRANSDGEASAGQIFNKGASTYLRITNEGADGLADLSASLDLASTDATLTISDVVKLNRWQHLAITYTDDGDDEITIYIDGNNVGSSTNGSGAPATDTNDLLIGGPASANFHGFIDEFKIYKEERSAAQIATDYERGSSSLHGSSARLGIRDYAYLSDGLIGHWRLDESSGNASDSSGNSTTLTNNGTTTFVNGKFSRGSEHVPASSQFFSTSSTIYGGKTVSFWVNPDANTNYYISLTSSAYITSSAGTLSATGFTNPTIYVNGIQSTTIAVDTWSLVSVTTDTAIDANQFYLGRQGSNYFDGTMDEVRLYKRVFSASEIRQMANWGPGPIGWWMMDENTGTSSINDSSGNGHTGTMNGSMTQDDWVNGQYGGALEFDGTDDSINVYSSSLANMFDGDQGTISLWVKVDPSAWSDSTDHRAISFGYDANNLVYVNKSTSNGLNSVYISGGSSKGSLDCQTSNTGWIFIAISWSQSGDQVKHYCNNSLTDTDTGLTAWSGAGDLESTRATIGSHRTTPSYVWKGAIDDVRVYNYVRSQGQIVEDMNAGHPLPGSPVGSPTMWWNFDEGYGTTANDSSSTGTYDGTLTGSPSWTNNSKFDRGVLIDADNEKVSAGDVAFTDSLTQMTISFWLNPSSLFSWHDFISKTNNSNQNSFRVCNYSSGGDEINVYIASGLSDTSNYFETSNLDLTTSTWYFLTVVYDGTEATSNRIKVYKNGNLVSGSVSGTIPTSMTSGSTSNLSVGDSDVSGGQGQFGTYDDVRIYTAALNSDQIKVLYNQGSSVVWGATSTDSSGNPTWSTLNEYCPPGQGSSCTAPVGHWKLDEKTGSAANDSSTNNYNGTVSDMDWVSGQKGSALSMRKSGTREYTSIADPASGDLDFDNTQSFTISTWLKMNDTTNTRGIIYKNYDGGNTNNAGYSITPNYAGGSEDIYCEYSGGNGGGTDQAYTWGYGIMDGNWHYITCVMDRSGTVMGTIGFYIFVDGILEGSDTSLTEPSAANSSALIIGESDAAYDMTNSAIDDVRIYRYARSPAQVAWEYNRGGPTGWWQFDECSGGTAYDASGNGNNGTITPGAGTHTSTGTCNSGSASEMWDDGGTGKVNYSLDFDGSDDYADMNDVNALDFNDQSFSISGWFNRETYTTDDTIVAKKNTQDNTTAGFIVWIDDSTDDLRLVVSDGDSTNLHTVDSTSTFTTTGWTHFVIVYDDSSSTGSKIYINGRDDAATNTTTGTFSSINNLSNSVDFRIGGESDTATDTPFAGELDDIKVFNYPLNATQVKTLYNQGAIFYGPATGSP